MTLVNTPGHRPFENVVVGLMSGKPGVTRMAVRTNFWSWWRNDVEPVFTKQFCHDLVPGLGRGTHVVWNLVSDQQQCGSLASTSSLRV